MKRVSLVLGIVLACCGAVVSAACGDDDGTADGTDAATSDHAATDVPAIDGSPKVDAAADAAAEAAPSAWPDGSLVPGPNVEVCPHTTTFIPDTPTCEVAVDSGCGCIEVATDMTCQAFCRGNLPCPPPCN